MVLRTAPRSQVRDPVAVRRERNSTSSGSGMNERLPARPRTGGVSPERPVAARNGPVDDRGRMDAAESQTSGKSGKGKPLVIAAVILFVAAAAGWTGYQIWVEGPRRDALAR